MAVKASREFQIFAKPVGALCNLDCHYCYYLAGHEPHEPRRVLARYRTAHVPALAQLGGRDSLPGRVLSDLMGFRDKREK